MKFKTIKEYKPTQGMKIVDKGDYLNKEDVSRLIDELIEEAKQKHREHFDNETIMKVGYHSKTWKVPKWLLSATREGVLEEIKKQIQGDFQ